METMRVFKSDGKEFKIIVVLSVILVLLLTYAALRNTTPLVTHTKANQLYKEGKIARLVLDKPYVYIITKSGERYKIYEKAINTKAYYARYPVEVKEDVGYLFDIVTLLFIGGAFFYLFNMMRRYHKQRLRTLTQPADIHLPDVAVRAQHSDVTFDDVAGIEEVKEELEEIIDFLRTPEKYRALDIRLPKGVLLVGPPGVGKTHIAKAVAGEADVPFFYQSGASFVHIYVGMGAKRVSELFAEAKRNAPAIIFIDEIDAVGKSRGELRNDEREATLNQLLTEMDGFESGSGVIVMAATNKIDVLDEALLRPGRFDRRVFISLPDLEDRKRILKLYLSKKPHSVDVDVVARMTVGFSAAALETLTNEAALLALRLGKQQVETIDFEAVKEKVLLGKRKILSYSDEERKIQAYYQAAKALTATWLDVEFEKIGIVNTQMVISEREIVSRSDLLNRIKIFLAGSVATQLRYNEHFTNAKEDIAQAKALISKVVYEYMMADNYAASAEYEAQLMQRSVEELRTLLKTLENALEKARTYLLEHENIDQETCREILRDLF
jgi:ATP-dependent metalloprotease FtsH